MRPKKPTHVLIDQVRIAEGVRPPSLRACGMGHADRIRAGGIHHRESDRLSPQARAAEGESEAVTAEHEQQCGFGAIVGTAKPVGHVTT